MSKTEYTIVGVLLCLMIIGYLLAVTHIFATFGMAFAIVSGSLLMGFFIAWSRAFFIYYNPPMSPRPITADFRTLVEQGLNTSANQQRLSQFELDRITAIHGALLKQKIEERISGFLVWELFGFFIGGMLVAYGILLLFGKNSLYAIFSCIYK